MIPTLLAMATPLVILAKTLEMEAGNQTLVGRLAVASTIYWRQEADPRRSLADVCLRTGYDCWNRYDPGDKVQAGSGKIWDECVGIAQDLLDGAFEPTIKANHYLNEKLVLDTWGQLPDWYALGTNKTVIGAHTFMWLERGGK
jgi:hypothetical protein